MSTTVVYGLAVFGPATTWNWWRGWVLLATAVIANVVALATLHHERSELFYERLKPTMQRGQPLVDKIILFLFLVTYGGSIALASLDVFRLHLAAQPPIWLASIGLVMFIAGWWMIGLALRDNNFATAVVRHQTERGHHVVDQGTYAIIRHPFYAGLMPSLLGAPLWLGSYAATLAAIVPVALIMLRIVFEEKFLRQTLDGYEAYRERVRYRLIPLVW